MKLLKLIFILAIGFSAGWLYADDASDAQASPDKTEAAAPPPAPDGTCSENCNIDQTNYSSPRTVRQDDLMKASSTTGTPVNPPSGDSTTSATGN